MLIMIIEKTRDIENSKVDEFCESKKNDDDESSSCDVNDEKLNCRRFLENNE